MYGKLVAGWPGYLHGVLLHNDGPAPLKCQECHVISAKALVIFAMDALLVNIK